MPASTAATTATAAVTTRGGRATVSGVAKIEVAAPTNGSSSNGAMFSAAGHVKVPAAVLQRIQQLGHSNAATQAICTDPTASATASTPEAAVRAGAPVPLPPALSSTRGSTRARARGAKTSSSTVEASTASSPRSPDLTTKTSQLPFTAPEALLTAVEEVSEAVVSATVAAHKTASSSHAQDDGKEPLLMPRQQKPVIFSRQWRRQLFAGTASSSLPLASGKPIAGSTVEDVLRGHGQSIGRRARGDVRESDSDSVADEEGDDDEEDASPFGKASVIKFSRTDGGSGVPGRLAAAPPSGDFGDEEDQLSAESASMMQAMAGRAVYDRRNGAALQFSGAPTRRQRHQLRQQAQEAREHHRVRRHMAGFDPDFLSRQESRLQVHRERDSNEEVEDEESGAHSSEGETDYSASSTAESEALSSVSAEGDDDEAEEAEEDGDVDGDLLDPSASAPHGDLSAAGGDGFGAAERTEHERQGRAHDKSGTAAPPAVIDEPGDSGSSTSPAAARSQFFQSFFFACHEDRMRRSDCHHTLVGLRDTITIKGPCGIIGFGLGEVSVNGFYLGRKQLTLWHEEHRAVLMPMKRLKTRHAQDMELPQWPRVPAPPWPPRSFLTAAAAGESTSTDVGDALGQPLNPLYYRGVCDASRSRTSATSLQWSCESVFGAVDWDWVEATVQSWRNLFSNQLPPIFLIVQPPSYTRRHGDEGPTRRFYLTRKRGRQDGAAGGKSKVCKKGGVSQDAAAAPSSAYMDIPSFVAHRSEPSVDLALVPSIVPSIAAQGCGSVMVLGSANIGKSTLCRYLANVLLSQHGLCYWLDLDVGQPEFGVPGQLTLSIVRRPLLRAHDASCAQVVAAFFIGASTAAPCPLTAANALAAVCAQARAVSREHPVVVNTHGWVLQTGRRVSVEALRRLRPRQVIHLHKAREELWVRDTAALLDPRNGLNAEKNRIKAAPLSSSTPSVALLCRLPYPHAREDAVQLPAPTDRESPVSSLTTTSAYRWRGQVHSVRVEREETYSSIARIKATKGNRGRQQRWETYFSALLRHYTGSTAAGAKAASGDLNAGEEEPETTLLEAPLSALHSIVLAERDEKLGDVCLLAAALEHAVVAVLFHAQPSAVAAHGQTNGGERCGIVRSLASLQNGFPVSCYGVVESGERELLHGVEAAQREKDASSSWSSSASVGWIRIRVPLRPSVVAAMLSNPERGPAAAAAKWCTRVSIAYSAALRSETAFVDAWR
ncbi:Molybdopterin guanine dinucleotide synthesis protein B family protein [Leishmania donovani]|uniref:Molybdopterin guanine dinucleotide synthesis protein B family protein n=1 Tax=Leishmania donovani TaxID=5661 RepID=A0A504XJZ7_LEIDO|nr:Molybdopterin guanine dinucleotide synthesis protein B family protein [Leishmania donovani]